MKNNFFFFFEKNLTLIHYNNLIIKSTKKSYKNNFSQKNRYLQNILLLILKNGHFKKTNLIFFKIIPNFNSILQDTNNNISNELIYNFNSMNNYNNLNFLLIWAFNNINTTFQIIPKEIPKKYKKKYNNKYIFNLKYVFKKNRNRIRLFLIKKYFITIQKTLNISLFKLFFELIFNYKNSLFYLNKIKLYNKLLK